MKYRNLDEGDNMNCLISVIIPVYNVSKYLVECLDSVINQTYKNLEIILIDDGSTDGSGEICDKYAKIDNRIIVIHQKNSGAGAAKNAGLKIATGDILAFVDSDDYLEKDAYEYMTNIMNEEHADIVHCSFRNIFINKKEDKIFINETMKYNSESYLELFLTDWTCGLLWNKLYRKKLFDDIFFKENRIIDDEFFTYQGVMNASKIIYTTKIIYNYRQRKSSVMLSDKNKSRIINDKLDYITERKDKIVKKYATLKNKFNYNLYEHLYILLKNSYCDKDIKNKIRKILIKNISLTFNVNYFLLFIKILGLSFKNSSQHIELIVNQNEYYE